MKTLVKKVKIKSNKILSSIPSKSFFVKSDLAPLISSFNIEELPDKETAPEHIYESRKTYTKWFNPNSFDPRTPDYTDSVKSTWEQDASREDFGSGK
jgi:hypothetical protein